MNESPWIDYCRYVLWFCGACYVLLGLTMGPAMLFTPDMPMAFNIFFAALMGLLGVGIGIFNFVVASGLASRKRWCWFAGLILGGIYTPSICLPFGVVLLIGMLRPEVKSQFGV